MADHGSGDPVTSAGIPSRTWDDRAVGFNPYRRHRRRPADIALVVGALVIVAALVGWALAG